MKVLTLGNELLREKSLPVEKITPEYIQKADAMFDIMLEKAGVGLASPQIGVMERMFVIMVDDEVRRVFINPQIISTSSDVCEIEEGCLSIPGLYENIVRPTKITVQAFDQFGKAFTLEADGFLARVIQHKYDHLDGILYIDRGTPEFKAKAEETCRKRDEKRKEKEAAKLAKAAKIEDKKAAKA